MQYFCSRIFNEVNSINLHILNLKMSKHTKSARVDFLHSTEVINIYASEG